VDLEQIAGLISSIGVPTAIAFYLLWRVEDRLDALNERLGEVVETLTRVVTLVEKGG